MKTLTFQQWAIATIVLQQIGWLGSIFDVTALNVVATIGLLALVIERIAAARRSAVKR